VKLLFDENLSPRLANLLATEYPASVHVHLVGLGAALDTDVWAYARAEGYVVVSKDADFFELSILHGAPPKLVWIRRGNCSTTHIVALLQEHRAEIEQFAVDERGRYLVIE
jgi:predicted nuclease of predicted toxin-antitoxin system